MRRRAAGFFFDGATCDADLPAETADFLPALEVAAGRCADLAGVVLTDADWADEFFAVDGAEVTAGGFLAVVFFGAGAGEAVPVAAAEDCAGRLPTGHSRQTRNAATRNKVILSSIPISPTNGRAACDARMHTKATVQL